MTIRRVLVAALALGVLSLVGTGCSSTMSDAATVRPPEGTGVGTTGIPDAQFRAEVDAVSSSPALRTALEQNFRMGPPGVSTDARLTAAWLTQRIRQVVVDDEFERLKLSLPAGAEAQATATLRENYSAEAWDGFPAAMRRRLVMGEAHTAAVLRTCLSGRSVSHILVATPAEAAAAKQALAAGESFAAVAARVSADPGSKGTGGNLGCLAPGAYVAPFQTAADRAPLGVVVGPVRTRFGYHLILVTAWKPEPSPSEASLQQLAQAATMTLNDVLARYEVRVSSEYGTWGKVTGPSGEEVLAVEAPAVPDPRNGRNAK